MYSKLVKRTQQVITAKRVFFTFLHIANNNHNGSNDIKTIGNLAVHSLILPKNLNPKHSNQKNRGGFSKKYSPFKYNVR